MSEALPAIVVKRNSKHTSMFRSFCTWCDAKTKFYRIEEAGCIVTVCSICGMTHEDAAPDDSGWSGFGKEEALVV